MRLASVYGSSRLGRIQEFLLYCSVIMFGSRVFGEFFISLSVTSFFIVLVYSCRFQVRYHPVFNLLGFSLFSLFIFLMLNDFYIQRDFSVSLLQSLWEYRILIAIPIIILMLQIELLNKLFFWFLASACVGNSVLIISEIMLVNNLVRSAFVQGSHIINGYLFSTAILVCLGLYLNHKSRLLILLACFFTFSLMWFSHGRVGYMQTILIWLLFAIACHPARKIVAVILFISIGLSFASDGYLWQQIGSTINNFEKALNGDYSSSLGIRFDFYVKGIELASRADVGGYGLSGLTSLLKEASDNGFFYAGTVDLHSEYLKIFLAGGVFAFSLFVMAIWVPIFYGLIRLILYRDHRFFLLVGVHLIFGLGMIFNSSFSDFGEKSVYVFGICLALKHFETSNLGFK